MRRKDTSARLDECKNGAQVGAITDLDWARLARHDSVGLGIGTKQRSTRCLLRIRPTVPSWHYCLPRSLASDGAEASATNPERNSNAAAFGRLTSPRVTSDWLDTVLAGNTLAAAAEFLAKNAD